MDWHITQGIVFGLVVTVHKHGYEGSFVEKFTQPHPNFFPQPLNFQHYLQCLRNGLPKFQPILEGSYQVIVLNSRNGLMKNRQR